MCDKTAVGSILKGRRTNTDISLQHKVAFRRSIALFTLNPVPETHVHHFGSARFHNMLNCCESDLSIWNAFHEGV